MLNGDLKLFNQVIDKYKEKFLSEKTYTLIVRLKFVSLFSILFWSKHSDHSLEHFCKTWISLKQTEFPLS